MDPSVYFDGDGVMLNINAAKAQTAGSGEDFALISHGKSMIVDDGQQMTGGAGYAWDFQICHFHLVADGRGGGCLYGRFEQAGGFREKWIASVGAAASLAARGSDDPTIVSVSNQSMFISRFMVLSVRLY